MANKYDLVYFNTCMTQWCTSPVVNLTTWSFAPLPELFAHAKCKLNGAFSKSVSKEGNWSWTVITTDILVRPLIS